MCKFWKLHHQFIGFVVAILVCLIINLIALTCTNRTYNDGQQTILNSYKESLALIDSLQKQNEDALNKVLREREQTITKILSDTLIDSIQGLCPKQKEAVRRYVRPYLEITTRELDVQEKIKTNPNHEYQVLRDEIRSLLQLEFNKMQNEYESLEIWAAILTIVFLIFSFYSFFKTENLEEQGSQALGRIKDLEGDGRKIKDKMDEDRRTKVSEADGAIAYLKKVAVRNERELNHQIAEMKKESQTAFEEQSNNFIKGFNENLRIQNEKFDKLRDEMRKTVESYKESLFEDKIASIDGKQDKDMDLGLDEDDGRKD